MLFGAEVILNTPIDGDTCDVKTSSTDCTMGNFVAISKPQYALNDAKIKPYVVKAVQIICVWVHHQNDKVCSHEWH